MTTPHPCHIAYYLLNGVLSDRYLNPNCSHYADAEQPIAIDDIARAYYLLNGPKLQNPPPLSFDHTCRHFQNAGGKASSPPTLLNTKAIG